MLVCDRIALVCYDHTKHNREQTWMEIPFAEECPDGGQLVSLFEKRSFSEAAVREWIAGKERLAQNVGRIREELSAPLLFKLLQTHFAKSYHPEEVNEAIGAYNFLIVPANVAQTIELYPPEPSAPSASRPKDRTLYKFNGNIYNKRRLALAVVQEYVRIHPGITLGELSATFPDALQGSLGVVREAGEAKAAHTDYARRFFTNKQDTLLLQGSQAYVCSQWSIGNIGRFIERALSLGFSVESVHDETI